MDGVSKTSGDKKGTERKEESGDVSCETCEFYDYDEIFDEYYCNGKLDEDEMISFHSSGKKCCPYYRPYDEYKVVRRQN